MKPNTNKFLYSKSCFALPHCSHPVSGFRSPVSVFTDQIGDPIQFMHYLPFGETWVDQRATNWNSRYTFSGKEKDEETGYGYFGARYYNSDWSIWLSVDPLADKYPYQSPYVYCGNNPLNIIDPFGEDEWEVNTKGHITHVEGSEGKPDKMFALDKKGNRITDRKGNEKSVDVDKDIMNSLTSGTEKIYGKEVDYSKLDVTGKENIAQDMFGFMSEHTDVEWSYWGGTTKEGKSFAALSTSHERTSDPYSAYNSYMSSFNNGLSFFFHTHPRKEVQGMYSNDYDRNHRSVCREGSPNAVFGLMYRRRLYELDKPFEMKWNGERK